MGSDIESALPRLCSGVQVSLVSYIHSTEHVSRVTIFPRHLTGESSAVLTANQICPWIVSAHCVAGKYFCPATGVWIVHGMFFFKA